MNNGYYQNPVYPNQNVINGITQNTPQPPLSFGQQSTIQEQSYIENILQLNKGKVGRFYMTFPDSNEWRDRVFTGIIESAGRDHLIISDPKSGKRYLLELIYLTYADFDEKLIYSPEFSSAV